MAIEETLAPPHKAAPSTYASGNDMKETQLENGRRPESMRSGSSDYGSIAQDGIKQVEAITSAWTLSAMVTTYAIIFIVSFWNSLSEQVTNNLAAYLTSSFYSQPLYATTSTLSLIIGGVAKLPIAKIIDIWGRVEGFCLMVFFTVLGFILMAACQNVETYAAAQVFYWLGFDGMLYVISIVVADTTSLRNRIIILSLTNTPYIATTFAGPAIAQAFYTQTPNFRWAFGAFAVVTPFVASALVGILVYNQTKAKKLGLVVKRAASGRSLLQSIRFYAIEFDIIGMILLIAGFSLVLLPLTLASSFASKWQSSSIIAEIVVGGICLIAFVIWERFLAPVCFLPWRYLHDRTIMGGCILAATVWISFYCWDLYLSPYLQVVNEQTIANAGYIANIYSIGSCIWGPITGLLIRYTGRFKWISIAAIPLMAMGTALLIYFRRPGTSIGYIIMCQIFVSVAGGTLVMTEQIAVMSAVPHAEVAVVLAIQALFTSIGGSIGQAISGAIYTNTLPGNLARLLPPESQANATAIYGSIVTQLSYPVGSPTRDAINTALGDTQHDLLIAGACFMPLALLSVLMWKNINVKEVKQTKGRVF